MEKTKLCNKCKIEKVTEKFYKNKNAKDGMQSICKECKREVDKAYRAKNKDKISSTKKEYYEKNKESILEYNRKYYTDNKESYMKYKIDNKEKIAEQRKKYYEDNKGNILEKGRKYHKENREILLLKMKEYNKKNEENIKEYSKEYYQNNKGRYKEWRKLNYNKTKEHQAKKNKEYIQNNKERVSAYRKQYQQNNKIIWRMGNQKQRASKVGLQNTLTIEEYEVILEDFGNSCAYCGKTNSEHLKEIGTLLHQEHFIALSKGGEYTRNNIIPSCMQCNSSKNNRNFFEWYPTYEHYSKEKEKFILEYLGYADKNKQQLALFK